MKLSSAGVSIALILYSAAAVAGEIELRIALTNDDGWQTEGIQAVYRALEAAGHEVTLAAPADQQSGSGTSLNAGDLRVVRETDDQFSVYVCNDPECTTRSGAEPATSAMIAIDIATRRGISKPPDLLVSGINEGPNLGLGAHTSGTVGAAAVAAIRSLNGPLPAIAISTEFGANCGVIPECLRKHNERVSAFLSRLVTHLASQAGSKPLLPEGVILNINYPPDEPLGIRVVEQDRASLFNRTPVRIDIGCRACLDLEVGGSAAASVVGLRPDTIELAPDGELASFAAGYITIVPMRIGFAADNLERYAELFADFNINR